MNKKLFILLLISIFLNSCTKDEKRLVSTLHLIKNNRTELIGNKIVLELEKETLVLLRDYLESLETGNDLLNKLMRKKSSRKKMRKRLRKSGDLEFICSELLLENETLETIKNQCNIGFFDICPLSLSRYKKNYKEMIENLKDLIGEDFYQTDCNNFRTEEV